MNSRLTVAQIGVGYWGPNLMRNLVSNENCCVKLAVDLSAERRDFVQSLYPDVNVSDEDIESSWAGVRPLILEEGKVQEGKSSFYKKRGPEDSEIDVESTISKSFNLLRIVDNKRYPAFFYMKGQKYKLQIERYKK